VEQGTPKPLKITHSVEKTAVAVSALQGYNDRGPLTSEDEALGYLAKILVQAYLEQKNYAPVKHPTKQ
jgi:hypothetical protein